MKSILVALSCTVLFLTTQIQAQEIVLNKSMNLMTSQFDLVLHKTENNIKLFVDHYQIKLDKGSKITSPQETSGTLLQPVLKVSVKKCVFIVCEKIDVDIEFTLVKTTGTCDLNYILVGDMRRSSVQLAELYSHLNTKMCLTKTPEGATAQLQIEILKAPTFKKGSVQKEILKFFKLQADAIVESFSMVMKINGVTQIL